MWKKYFLNVANSAGERSGIRCKGNTIAFNVKPFVFVVIRFRSRRLRFRFSKCDLNVVMSFKIECIFVGIQFHKKYALFSKNSFDFENIHVRFENFHIIFVNMFKIKYLKELFYICWRLKFYYVNLMWFQKYLYEKNLNLFKYGNDYFIRKDWEIHVISKEWPKNRWNSDCSEKQRRLNVAENWYAPTGKTTTKLHHGQTLGVC